MTACGKPQMIGRGGSGSAPTLGAPFPAPQQAGGGAAARGKTALTARRRLARVFGRCPPTAATGDARTPSRQRRGRRRRLARVLVGTHRQQQRHTRERRHPLFPRAAAHPPAGLFSPSGGGAGWSLPRQVPPRQERGRGTGGKRGHTQSVYFATSSAGGRRNPGGGGAPNFDERNAEHRRSRAATSGSGSGGRTSEHGKAARGGAPLWGGDARRPSSSGVVSVALQRSSCAARSSAARLRAV